MIRFERVISESLRKSPRHLAISRTPAPQKKPRRMAEPDFARLRIRRYQRPKNSHSRMITGIGTPNSQSRIPRPMFASFEFLNRRENAKWDVRFQRGTGKADL
jgi:hypothetical protein